MSCLGFMYAVAGGGDPGQAGLGFSARFAGHHFSFLRLPHPATLFASVAVTRIAPRRSRLSCHLPALTRMTSSGISFRAAAPASSWISAAAAVGLYKGRELGS